MVFLFISKVYIAQNLYLQIHLAIVFDAKTVVGALANQPKYTVVGIGKHQLMLLIEERTFTVGEVIAD